MKRILSSIGFHASLLLSGFVMLYPLLWLLASSFKTNSTMFQNTWSLIPLPQDIIRNYTAGWQGIGGTSFTVFLFNSIGVTLIGTLLCILSSMLAAYAFARLKFRLQGFWFTCVMITLMIPPQIMVVPQYIILRALSLINTHTALVLPWGFGNAFFIFLLMQFFKGIPHELDEAAEIDGAGKIRILFSVMFPVMKPAVVTASIFAFYWIWQDFFQPLIFINQVRKFTLPLALNAMLDPTSYTDFGGLFAMSMASLVPIIVFFIIFQKQLVNGIAMEGIKG